MSCPRIEREKMEHLFIGPYGTLSENSRGRLVLEEECELRTCFQRDTDRITHSKAFRRLKHKTQVFLQPEGDHYRTRLTHTLEVTRLARTVARALQLNEDLAEAIGLGHDLGHTPFGHAGERALNRILEDAGGFKHYEQSLRVVDTLERDGRGLNLCYETRMGILNHTHGKPDDTPEATAVRLCDRIAYVNHDLDDAIRAGILSIDDVPTPVRRMCGNRNSERINSIITDLVANSHDGILQLSAPMQEVFDLFHTFMYSDVYTNPRAKGEENKVDGILYGLYTWYSAHPDALPEDYRGVIENEGIQRAVVDYISGMTDGYAMEKYSELYIPFAWTVK
ncbi:MAG: deoxyguanosinetriphosphate triphosphohydrolase [Oscillospiraceae bacterium]|nr:deoxyguanosinetriphosphate triphosphohydrolase [Oscillospiraceae bacterium]